MGRTDEPGIWRGHRGLGLSTARNRTISLSPLAGPDHTVFARPIMSVDTFEASLHHATPPDGWSYPLQALWWDARGDWNKAHDLAQIDDADPQCAWVHAYLHRKEGDLSNAAYWYRRSAQSVATGSLTHERQLIAASLLGGSSIES
jgi:hypothetical protein